MRLVFHGGKCCGIKTIYDMGSNPQKNVLPVYKKNRLDDDINGSHVSSDTDFFTDEAPRETHLQRLDRLIAFCDKYRPNGIIEITLAESQHYFVDQFNPWKHLLYRRRFKRVTSCYNSNSGNRVHVFHRTTDKRN